MLRACRIFRRFFAPEKNVENYFFGRFFHRKDFRRSGCGKLCPSKFQMGNECRRRPARTVKNKENPSTFFFIKGKMPGKCSIFFQQQTGCNTTCIGKLPPECGKPGGKSGKPHGKLPFFFTKMVENPVEKVKSSFRNEKCIRFPVVLLCQKTRWMAVFLPGAEDGFPHRGFS